jgi:putative transposase
MLKRVLAQTDISFSNSLIEAWWRALKHQWLYLNALDSVPKLRSLVAYYVEQHNERIPHSAFRGQTPDEMYFGTGSEVPGELEQAKRRARERRLERNRARRCGVCA